MTHNEGSVVHVKLRKKHARTVWKAAVKQVQSKSREQTNNPGTWLGCKWDPAAPFPGTSWDWDTLELGLKQLHSSSFEGPARFRRRGQRTESSEEEFFCLTPDDPKQSRSRNASSSSGGQGQQQKFHPMAAPRNVITGLTEPFISSSSSHPVADTKIFSVAVEATSRLTSKMDSMKVCDLDTGFSGQFAIVSPKVNRETGGCAIAAGNKGSKSKEEEDVTTTEGSKAKKSKKKKSSKEKKAEVESLKADLLKVRMAFYST